MTNSTLDRIAAARPTRGLAVREVAIFISVTALLTAASTTVAWAEDVDVRRIDEASALGQTAMYLQAMFPLIAAVLARLLTHGTLRRPEWGFRRTPWRTIAVGWAYGLAVALAGALLLWGSGAGGFDTDSVSPGVLAGLTVLVLPYVVLAIGEDVGWRGLLVTRLAEFCSPRVVVLVGGLLWSAFHWPLIVLLGGTPEGVSVWFALAMFTVGITSLGAVLATMQLRWGIWPGVVAHAVVNATLYHVVEPLTLERGDTNWFATETGLFAAVAGLAAAALWWRRIRLVARAGGGSTVTQS